MNKQALDWEKKNEAYVEDNIDIIEKSKEGFFYQRLIPLSSMYDVRVFALMFFSEIYNILNYILPFNQPLNHSHYMPNPILKEWDKPEDRN